MAGILMGFNQLACSLSYPMGLKDKLYDAFSKFHPTTAAAFTSIPSLSPQWFPTG